MRGGMTRPANAGPLSPRAARAAVPIGVHVTSTFDVPRRRVAPISSVGLATMLLMSASVAGAAQAPAAKSDALIIDVQVVDRDGLPVANIAADKFDVEIGGRKRRVLSVQLVQAAAVATPDASAGRQVYFVAIDALSFGPGVTKAVATATKAFIETLPAGSLVGIATFPQGPSVELTSDRAALAAALDTLSGQRPSQRSSAFNLGAADVIEYVAANDRTSIIQSHCPELEDSNGCAQSLDQDVMTAINVMETQARASVGMLADFAARLGRIPGRKVLVLVSAGLMVADRSGVRPDVSSQTTDAADSTTRSNVTVYGLFLDRILEGDRVQSSTARQPSNPARERDLLARWLDQFSTSMGGALVKVQVGQGREAYARIARETASHYLLTVESTDADRGERPQRLRVRVNERGTTVRSRTLVAGK